MESRVTELTENDVVDAVCSELRARGWTIESRASTTERGVDVVARGPKRAVLRVEAKGATSSKASTARHGHPFSSAPGEDARRPSLLYSCCRSGLRFGA